MAFKMNGWSAFKNEDDDKAKKLRKLRDRYIEGNAATRDSIINLPIIKNQLKKEKNEKTNYFIFINKHYLCWASKRLF